MEKALSRDYTRQNEKREHALYIFFEVSNSVGSYAYWVTRKIVVSNVDGNKVISYGVNFNI